MTPPTRNTALNDLASISFLLFAFVTLTIASRPFLISFRAISLEFMPAGSKG